MATPLEEIRKKLQIIKTAVESGEMDSAIDYAANKLCSRYFQNAKQISMQPQLYPRVWDKKNYLHRAWRSLLILKKDLL